MWDVVVLSVAGVALVGLTLSKLQQPRAPEGAAPRTSSSAPARSRKPARARHAGPFHWEGSGNFDFPVVGESHYQPALAKLAGDHGTAYARAEHVATLVLDDANNHDSKAVAVLIGDEKVGYLAKQDARSYRRRLGQNGLSGIHATCDAVVLGGETRRGEKQFYGVMLDMKPFE